MAGKPMMPGKGMKMPGKPMAPGKSAAAPGKPPVPGKAFGQGMKGLGRMGKGKK